jgi:hypothetical protein
MPVSCWEDCKLFSSDAFLRIALISLSKYLRHIHYPSRGDARRVQSPIIRRHMGIHWALHLDSGRV